jgi:hypothetical protein
MIGLSLALFSSFSMQPAHPRQRILHHADDMRRAAHRIAVLQALLVARIAGGGRRRGRPQPAAATRIWPGCGFTANRRSSKWCGLPRIASTASAVSRQHSRDRYSARSRGQAGQRGHHRGAVHDRQALLGAQRERLEGAMRRALRRRRLAIAQFAVEHLAFAAQHRGDIRQRCQVTAGARPSLRMECAAAASCVSSRPSCSSSAYD